MAQTIIKRKQVEGVIAFKVRRNSTFNITAGAGTDIVYDAKYYDTANAYSTSTGLFTAPVSGIYQFTANTYTETTTTGRVFMTSRGSSTTGIPSGWSIGRSSERGLDTDSSYVRRGFGSWEVYMVAGETFGTNIYSAAAENINDANTWFAGHLVAETQV